MFFGNPACIQLTDADEVEAWVASSTSRPLRARVVLHRVFHTMDKPSPASLPYIEDDDYLMINMLVEDSNHDQNMRVTGTGKKVGMPWPDESL